MIARRRYGSWFTTETRSSRVHSMRCSRPRTLRSFSRRFGLRGQTRSPSAGCVVFAGNSLTGHSCSAVGTSIACSRRTLSTTTPTVPIAGSISPRRTCLGAILHRFIPRRSTEGSCSTASSTSTTGCGVTTRSFRPLQARRIKDSGSITQT